MRDHRADVDLVRGDQVQGHAHLRRRAGVGVHQHRSALPQVVDRELQRVPGGQRREEEDASAVVDELQRLLHRRLGRRADEDALGQAALVDLLDTVDQILAGLERLVGAEAPRRLQSRLVDVGGDDLAGLARAGELDVQDARDPRCPERSRCLPDGSRPGAGRGPRRPAARRTSPPRS